MTRERTSSRLVGLVALLVGAMVTATYMQGALAVLASFVLDELGITRSQLGVAIAAFSTTGALVSPLMGNLTDRSPRRVITALFAASAAGMAISAAAPSYGVLLVGSVIGGLALGAGNPVTNRIISERVPPPRRGLVIGLKQSGPPLGILASGALLPVIAVTFDWRLALALSTLMPLAGLAATRALLPGSPGGHSSVSTTSGGEIRTAVVWLTLIGLGVAMGQSAVIAFLPLYAQESIGLAPTTAGALASFLGLVGVAGRILWGNFGGRFARATTPLLIMSTLAIAASVSLLAAARVGASLLWLGALGAGISMMAWHAVGWVVIIRRVGTAGVGRASGVMQVGNSIGFASGPPLAGLVVDLTGSYTMAWTLVAALFGVVTAFTLLLRVRTPTG